MRQIFRALSFSAALLPAAAEACVVSGGFPISEIGAADLIVTGRVTDFEEVSLVPRAALVTIRVAEVMKGVAEEGADMVLVWNSGQAGGPDAWLAQGDVLVAAMAAGRAEKRVKYDHRPDLPMIVQPNCSSGWIKRLTPRLRAEVKAVIAP
jgi:hypothetical protein